MKTKKVNVFSYARSSQFMTMSVFIDTKITNTNIVQNIEPSTPLTWESYSFWVLTCNFYIIMLVINYKTIIKN